MNLRQFFSSAFCFFSLLALVVQVPSVKLSAIKFYCYSFHGTNTYLVFLKGSNRTGGITLEIIT